MSFGQRVRQERQRAGLTLEQLAARSRVSRAALSKTERGQQDPTLQVALRIAEGLGVPIAQLLSTPTAEPIVVHGDEGRALVDQRTGAVRVALFGDVHGVECVRYHLPPESSTGEFDPHPGGTREIFIVLEGRLRVAAGPHHAELREGDVAHVAADLPHTLTNPSPANTTFVLIIIPPR
jgi:transcriptional regulator with XRE-family HTH domain